MNKQLGIIAGSGKLPRLFADEAKKRGFKVLVLAIRGETDEAVSSWADQVEWAKVGELGKVVKFFKDNHVREAVMGGKIQKTNLFKGEVVPDFEMIKLLATMRNHSDDSLLGAISDYLNEKGISIMDSTTFLTEEALPKSGVLSKQKPSQEELEDIDFGWHLAKEMGRLDIGQTVVVKKKAVLSVEAIEGTDEAILRGGHLGKGGVVVVKVAKPNQDMRFDVPAVGLGTCDALVKAGAKVLAFEAGKTILLDREEFLRRADREKMIIVAKEPS